MAGMASEFAKVLARKRWAGTSPEQRSASARKAAAARWSKVRNAKPDDPADLCRRLLAVLPAEQSFFVRPLSALLAAL